jgi:hypothetical protein
MPCFKTAVQQAEDCTNFVLAEGHMHIYSTGKLRPEAKPQYSGTYVLTVLVVSTISCLWSLQILITSYSSMSYFAMTATFGWDNCASKQLQKKDYLMLNVRGCTSLEFQANIRPPSTPLKYDTHPGKGTIAIINGNPRESPKRYRTVLRGS